MGWGSVVSSAISAIGSAISSSQASHSASQANKTNKELFREGNNFNAQQAKINRDWATKLANTAYQRERADLEAAGYNPLLAVNGSGASTPSSGSASSTSAPTVQPEFNDYGLSKLDRAFTSAKQAQEMDVLRAQEENLKKQSDKIDADIKGTNATTAHTNAQTAKTLKEAESIDPVINKDNARYGNGLVGEAAKFAREVVEGIGLKKRDTSLSAPASESVNSGFNLFKKVGEVIRNQENRQREVLRQRADSDARRSANKKHGTYYGH